MAGMGGWNAREENLLNATSINRWRVVLVVRLYNPNTPWRA